MFSRLIGNREGDEVWEDLGIVEDFDQRKVSVVLEEVSDDVTDKAGGRALCSVVLVKV